MKASLLSLVLLAGCGALFNDDLVPLRITASPDTVIWVDGLQSMTPVGVSPMSGTVMVAAHHAHFVTAYRDGKLVGSCDVMTSVKARYVLGDILLIEMIFPIVIDAVTGDWGSPDRTECAF